MRGRKQTHSKSMHRTRKRAKNLGNLLGRVPPKQNPDGKTPCMAYVESTCVFYSGKELKKMCPRGLGYIRHKNQNPNNWAECDGWYPNNEKKRS